MRYLIIDALFILAACEFIPTIPAEIPFPKRPYVLAGRREAPRVHDRNGEGYV
jgi:hypothetical protein